MRHPGVAVRQYYILVKFVGRLRVPPGPAGGTKAGAGASCTNYGDGAVSGDPTVIVRREKKKEQWQWKARALCVTLCTCKFTGAAKQV